MSPSTPRILDDCRTAGFSPTFVGAIFVLAVGAVILGPSPLLAGDGSMVFQDDFETGGSTQWSFTDPGTPPTPRCNCYFSGDCPSGQFCNWGPGGPFTQDICIFSLPKPNGVVGAGCDVDAGGPGAVCDGFCSPSESGSFIASEDRTMMTTGVQLWSEAMLRPAASPGGGPIDSVLAKEALDLGFANENLSWVLGRHTADVLMLTADRGFYDHFCHYENDMEDPAFFVDLSTDLCRIEAGRFAAQALIAEIDRPGSGIGQLDRIPSICHDWQQMFAPRCGPGADALECIKRRLEETARYLTTLRGGSGDTPAQ